MNGTGQALVKRKRPRLLKLTDEMLADVYDELRAEHSYVKRIVLERTLRERYGSAGDARRLGPYIERRARAESLAQSGPLDVDRLTEDLARVRAEIANVERMEKRDMQNASRRIHALRKQIRKQSAGRPRWQVSEHMMLTVYRALRAKSGRIRASHLLAALKTRYGKGCSEKRISAFLERQRSRTVNLRVERLLEELICAQTTLGEVRDRHRQRSQQSAARIQELENELHLTADPRRPVSVARPLKSGRR